MIRLSRGFLERALAGRDLRLGASVPDDLGEIATDTRADLRGKLFVALVGERFDAHAFVDEALAKGATAALVERARGQGRSPRLLEVDDTLVALQDLAATHLRESGVRRVALTGSNGKTTTKELVAACVRACVGEDAVLATAGNLNNHVGLPLTALRVEPRHQVAVLEMGMNHLGEIERLCAIARPEVGLITNIGTAHAGNLGGVEGVARAKGELFEGLAPDGIGVVNADDARCLAQADSRLRGRRVTFGRAARVDVRLLSVKTDPERGLVIQLWHEGATVTVRLPLEGEHNAQNAAGAVATAVALGLPFETAAHGLENSASAAGRLVRTRAASGALLLDDTYNANPDSMRAGLLALSNVAGDRRRCAALGEMLELGDEAEALHEDTGAAVAEAGVTRAFFCGTYAEAYKRGAERAGLAAAAIDIAADSAALAPLVAGAVGAHDAVLVKGSRGARMERVVEHLATRAPHTERDAGTS